MVQGQRQAYGAIYGILLQQSALLAYVHTYRWLVIAILLCLPAAFLMKKAMARPTHVLH
jgi:hypothetical protein